MRLFWTAIFGSRRDHARAMELLAQMEARAARRPSTFRQWHEDEFTLYAADGHSPTELDALRRCQRVEAEHTAYAEGLA